MSDQPIRVLVVEDDTGDARFVQEALKMADVIRFECVHVARLNLAIERLQQEHFDILLLDLDLPDGNGLDLVIRAHQQAAQVPIVVLTGSHNESLAVAAVQAGAQDYLIKDRVDSDLLVRALRYALERHRLLTELQAMSLVDELTQLYNRRGFTAVSRQQLKLAERTNRGMLLIFADLDNMKWINDSLGHAQGDEALKDMAHILRQSFRDSDIIGRLGGDEFVVLTIESSGASASILTVRLQENLESYNALAARNYKLSLSLGVVRFHPSQPQSIEELIARADDLMYCQKRRKKKA